MLNPSALDAIDTIVRTINSGLSFHDKEIGRLHRIHGINHNDRQCFESKVHQLVSGYDDFLHDLQHIIVANRGWPQHGIDVRIELSVLLYRIRGIIGKSYCAFIAQEKVIIDRMHTVVHRYEMNFRSEQEVRVYHKIQRHVNSFKELVHDL